MSVVISKYGNMLSTSELYALLRLRAEVFVVEQHCVYNDLDDRDLLKGTRHVWIPTEDGEILTTLRVLEEAGARRIGRVITRTQSRGKGLAAELMHHVLEALKSEVHLSAQSHLCDWYAGFGFQVCGEGYLEDGIPHLPMRLESKD